MKFTEIKREERAGYVHDMQQLIDLAESEERGLTETEQSEFDERESMIKSIDQKLKEAMPMNNTNKKIEQPSVNINTGKGSHYSLQKVLSASAGKSQLDGIEAEHDQQLKSDQPNREYNGVAVPLTEILLNEKQRRDVVSKAVEMGIVTKASGVVSPTNLLPLVGEDYRDELFTLIDGAIGQQLISGRVGARVITTNEQTVKIPRQTAMATVDHVAIDTDLPDSADPTFSNQTLTPKLMGGVSQLNLSAMLAQHPAVGTNEYFASELHRALGNEIENVFLSGSNTTNPEEPNGIEQLATASAYSVRYNTNALNDLDDIQLELADYLQNIANDAQWLVAKEWVNKMKGFASPGTSTESLHAALGLRNGMINNQPAIEALNLTKTINDYTHFHGDFSSIVHCLWSGVDVAVNPFADSVFKKGATLIRVFMMHDIGIVDPKRLLKFNAAVAV